MVWKQSKKKEENKSPSKEKPTEIEEERSLRARGVLAKKLDSGELEEREVEIETNAPVNPIVQVMTGGPNLEDLDMQVQNVLGDFLPKKVERRRVKLCRCPSHHYGTRAGTLSGCR